MTLVEDRYRINDIFGGPKVGPCFERDGGNEGHETINFIVNSWKCGVMKQEDMSRYGRGPSFAKFKSSPSFGKRREVNNYYAGSRYCYTGR